MPNVTRKESPNGLQVWIEGAISESFDFNQAFGKVPKELHVYCGSVSRITSYGVKKWIQYFQELKKNGVRFTFHECSPAILEQITVISNFLAGGEVESMYVPLSCSHCNSESIELYDMKTFRDIGYHPPEVKCQDCSRPTSVDVIVWQFLELLRNRGEAGLKAA